MNDVHLITAIVPKIVLDSFQREQSQPAGRWRRARRITLGALRAEDRSVAPT